MAYGTANCQVKEEFPLLSNFSLHQQVFWKKGLMDGTPSMEWWNDPDLNKTLAAHQMCIRSSNSLSKTCRGFGGWWRGTTPSMIVTLASTSITHPSMKLSGITQPFTRSIWSIVAWNWCRQVQQFHLHLQDNWLSPTSYFSFFFFFFFFFFQIYLLAYALVISQLHTHQWNFLELHSLLSGLSCQW